MLYSNSVMQSKLLQAYEQKAKGKKTLIFNAGINTSRHVYETFIDGKKQIKICRYLTPSMREITLCPDVMNVLKLFNMTVIKISDGLKFLINFLFPIFSIF